MHLFCSRKINVGLTNKRIPQNYSSCEIQANLKPIALCIKKKEPTGVKDQNSGEIKSHPPRMWQQLSTIITGSPSHSEGIYTDTFPHRQLTVGISAEIH